MTEKEALEQSLQHWRDNFAKVKATTPGIESCIYLNAHAFAEGRLGIAIDNTSCAMCKYNKNMCHRCILWDEPDENGRTCCIEWRRVYKSLCNMYHTITEQQLSDIITAISSMVKRLEHELEVYDDRDKKA